MAGHESIERSMRGRILIVDDDPLVRWSLRERLEAEGHTLLEAEDGERAWQLFEGGVDVILLDHRLPDIEGVDLLRRLTAADTELPIIMLTAFSSIEHAVEAMRIGAYHYAGKPFDLDEVSLLIQRALRESQRDRSLRALRASRMPALDKLIGTSPAIEATKKLLRKVARSPSSTVLITGESGTGKDLAARIVHSLSERAEGPFLNVTCSALNANLLESELFGYERGAFTDAKERRKGLFEQAHTGTIFLDEIGEVSLDMQAKLLRFLEEKVFRRVGGWRDLRADVRVIAATNVEMQAAVRNGGFREDLYYRLAVLTVQMPPLRDRTGDLLLLANHFIDQFNQEFHKRIERIARGAVNALEAYSWPGNVREFRNAIERAVLLAEQPTLNRADFMMIDAPEAPRTLEAFVLPPRGIDFSVLERTMVEQALDRAKGNRTLAASLLGMNRDQIRYRIDKFGLSDHLRPSIPD